MADATARPVDRIVAGYLVLSAVALAFPHRPGAWPLLVLLHLLAAAVLLAGVPDRYRWRPDEPGVRPSDSAATPGPARRRQQAAAIVADWYPLALVPLIYLEIQLLNTAVWDGHYFDGVIMGWEETLFGGQPSVTLAMQWDSLLLSELLHLAYLSFYFVVYLFPLWLYLAGRRQQFRKTVFALMLAFVAHYLVFVFFPVQGPRYLFPGPGGTQTDGFFYGLARSVLESGSSQGAAFPSSHVALAAVQTGNALRFAPRVAPLLAVFTLGIALGAVYGGFHYGIDATIGLLVGVGLALLAPPTWRALR